MPLPLVAIVGRPNVGKSTLLNRFAGRRISIVDDAEGVTRDRVSVVVEHGGRKFEAVDTGGIGFVDESRLLDHVRQQIEVTLERADVVLFLVDGRVGVADEDRLIAERFRRAKKRSVLVANKCEKPQDRHEAGQFLRLGLGEAQTISGLTGEGVEELLDRLVTLLPEAGEREEAEVPVLRLAIVGRQNAGKSTLVNALAREERVIVSEVAGTTRDAIDVLIDRGDERWLLIDTAGVRKKTSLGTSVDFFSQARSERAIRRADVVALLLDCSRDIGQVDKKLARFVQDCYKPCVIVANKRDLAEGIEPDAFLEYIEAKLPGLSYAPILFISALERQGLEALTKVVRDLFEQSRMRVPTADVNRALARARETRLPKFASKLPKMFYATQIEVQPPTFVVFVNDPKLFTKSYDRFLQNRFREELPFPEIPLRIYFREREKVRLSEKS
ncbi:MAG: ribosome biogenesis GTPase Der [Planctomycetes bacterium]|nr:ribosome biogenesis GTPase Der [Planctomycetota bacterium]